LEFWEALLKFSLISKGPPLEKCEPIRQISKKKDKKGYEQEKRTNLLKKDNSK
jgi:hypothetical protein